MIKRFAAMLASLGMLIAAVFIAPSPAQAAQNYYYAGARQTGLSVTAVRITAYIGNPWLSGYDQHTIWETSLDDTAGNVVEIGWGRFNHDTGVFPTNVPRLFAYRWTNGAPGGYSDSTWMPVSNLAGYTRGMDLSAFIGNTVNFEIRLLGDNSWSYRFNNVEFGRFPASNWTSPTFTQGATMQTFDEIATTRAIGVTCTDTEGAPPTLASATAGYLAGGALYLPGAVSASLTPFATNSAYWNAALPTGVTDGVNLGGPGPC
jgi:hypothetical protein